MLVPRRERERPGTSRPPVRPSVSHAAARTGAAGSASACSSSGRAASGVDRGDAEARCHPHRRIVGGRVRARKTGAERLPNANRGPRRRSRRWTPSGRARWSAIGGSACGSPSGPSARTPRPRARSGFGSERRSIRDPAPLGHPSRRPSVLIASARLQGARRLVERMSRSVRLDLLQRTSRRECSSGAAACLMPLDQHRCRDRALELVQPSDHAPSTGRAAQGRPPPRSSRHRSHITAERSGRSKRLRKTPRGGAGRTRPRSSKPTFANHEHGATPKP
jgi:hypothetical protein